MSPASIVEGRTKIDFSKKKVSFGTYVLAYAGTTSNIKSRDTPVTDLRMTINTCR